MYRLIKQDEKMLPLKKANSLFVEMYYYGPEIIRYADGFHKLFDKPTPPGKYTKDEKKQREIENQKIYDAELAKRKSSLKGYFKNYFKRAAGQKHRTKPQIFLMQCVSNKQHCYTEFIPAKNPKECGEYLLEAAEDPSWFNRVFKEAGTGLEATVYMENILDELGLKYDELEFATVNYPDLKDRASNSRSYHLF